MSIAVVADPDLAVCAREPIHVPGAIQPHGLLLVLREPGLEIVAASENARSLLGLEPGALRGLRLPELGDVGALLGALASGRQPIPSPSPVQIGQDRFDAIAHRTEGLLVIELERTDPSFGAAAFYLELQAALTELEAAPDLASLLQSATRSVARLTGFDRVMIYRFDPAWNGSVVAETLARGADSYLGHHFPASDIPAQARELYRRNRLRLIPRSAYQPAAIVPDRHPETGVPLDLSQAVLRSVSPVHLEYLQNMGVQASMSVSLLPGDRLWGLIACHHPQPRELPFSVRAACSLFGQVVATQIAAREERERNQALLEGRRIQASFFQHFSKEENFASALVKLTPELLQLVGAGGAALCLGDRCVLLGRTPGTEEVRALWAWLREQPNDGPFATDHLSGVYPPAAAFPGTASGLLAFSISRVNADYILWFRPEVVATITWAGNPHKAVEAESGRINPRKSFAAWREIVTGHSHPWREPDLQAALELRAAIGALILRRTDQLLRLNATLETRNTELTSFAYLSSHDLQEPLRGIRNLARFLQEDYGERLDEAGREKLATLEDLARQMHELIEALVHFTKLGRLAVQPRECELEQVLADVRVARAETLRGVELVCPRPLPRVVADPLLLREVLANLIVNAVKYNASEAKRIEVGWDDPPGQPRRFYVRDNGIGIREKHADRVFELFRRLHPRERFGGGTGVGLSVVKSIIDRHGGRVWFESEFGQGTTFFFTLEPAP
ncbi:MAG: GAF domain-containing protein [Verrucomicrobia bacterium]|nr:GAF domain-containing protein [Verrucomicrobiota bacterium]